MNDQNKIQRVLQLLVDLSVGYGKTKNQIAEKLDIHPRTVYRYLETIMSVGFVIEKNRGGYFHIPQNNPFNRDLSHLLYFSREESQILQEAIRYIDDTSAVKQHLTKKLYSLYNSRQVAQTIINESMGKNVRKLCDAMEFEKQVTLINYRSANASKINSRRIEPFEFTTNYISVWGYDLDKQKNRVFKTARIEDVEISNHYWQHKDKHQSKETDIFRVAGDNPVKVKLTMKLRAAELLKEEYPLSKDLIRPDGNGHFIFEGTVNGFQAVSRFILGLMDEIEVLEPEELKGFLNDKVKNRRF